MSMGVLQPFPGKMIDDHTWQAVDGHAEVRSSPRRNAGEAFDVRRTPLRPPDCRIAR